MNLRSYSVVLAAFSLLLIAGCSDKKRPDNVIETEEVPETFKLNTTRWDKELFANSGSLDSLGAWHGYMLAKGSPFYKIYLKEVLQILPDSGTTFSLYRFSGNPQWKELQTEIEKKYPTTDSIDQVLTTAFGRLKQLLPGKPTPDIYYFNSGFNVGIFPDSTLVGVGLEWYLGKDNRIIKSLPPDFPKYQRDNMESWYLPGDVVKGWLLVNYIKQQDTKNVLEYIVFYGKVMYAAEAALQPIADTTLFSYTAQQMDWCYKQEKRIWKEFVDKDLLYSAADKDLMRLTVDGPFTTGFPQDGAPMAGVYIGWKMVADYMKKNPGTSLNDLMNRVTATEILKTYKPKK